jgi:hypothetical protein
MRKACDGQASDKPSVNVEYQMCAVIHHNAPDPSGKKRYQGYCTTKNCCGFESYTGFQAAANSTTFHSVLFGEFPVRPSSMISITLPTSPVSKRTFMPWGCWGDFVRISFTTPRVRLPVRWSAFNTTSTVKPVRIFFRCWPFTLLELISNR